MAFPLKKIMNLDNFFNVPASNEDGDFESYCQFLVDGKFDDRLCYGISDKERSFMLLDPMLDPGALYCGGVGSGKSQGMKFTLGTHILANGHKTIYFLLDVIKGMGDYKAYFDLPNVIKVLNDDTKIIPLIEMIHHEMMVRKKKFQECNNAQNYDEYEKFMKQKDPNFTHLSRIIIAAEEFSSITTDERLKFLYNNDKPGTAAFLLRDILKVGRSYGIVLLAATQRAISEEFPNSLKVGTKQQMLFKINSMSDASALGFTHALEIKNKMSGRCAYQDGFIQFPFYTDDVFRQLYKTYSKKFNAELLSYSIDEFKKALESQGNEGLIQIKSFKSLFENWKQYSLEEIITRLLKFFNFHVEKQNNPGLGGIQLIAKRDGYTYGVNLIKESAGQTSEKVMSSILSNAKILKCDSIISVFMAPGQAPKPVLDLIKNTGGFCLDTEDLINIANIIDNKAQLEAEFKFESLYGSIKIASKVEALTSVLMESKPTEQKNVLTSNDIKKDENLNEQGSSLKRKNKNAPNEVISLEKKEVIESKPEDFNFSSMLQSSLKEFMESDEPKPSIDYSPLEKLILKKNEPNIPQNVEEEKKNNY